MRNITLGEWQGLLSGPILSAASGPRVIAVVRGIGLDLGARYGPTATVALSPDGMALAPEYTLSRSACAPYDRGPARAAYMDGLAVLDALDRAEAEAGGLRVWPDGCPCDYCQTSRPADKARCSYCGGTGTRHDPKG